MGDADEAAMLAGVAPARLRFRPQPSPLPVLAPEAGFDDHRFHGRIDARLLAQNSRQIVGVKGLPPVECERFVIRAAEETEIGLVDEFAPAVGAGHPHRHGRAVGDGAETRFALGDRALGQFALRDVRDDHVNAEHPTR